MFKGILHLFQRDDAFSWRDIFQIVKTSSLQIMPWSLEQITAYINETEFEILVLEPVSRRLHAFYAILYLLKVFFKILLHPFQTEIAVLQRECTKSGRTLFMEYHVLKKIQLGFIDVGWLLQKMLNPYPKCTLLLIFAYFVSIVAAFFEKCQALQKARWNTKLFSEHLILSQFGEKKAGTKCRSHEVEGFDLDLSGLTMINPD